MSLTKTDFCLQSSPGGKAKDLPAVHPGEDLLDFNEPKKANFNMGGGESFGYPPNISHQWKAGKSSSQLPLDLLVSGRVKVEVMFLDPFLGHDVDVDALERLLFDFIFTGFSSVCMCVCVCFLEKCLSDVCFVDLRQGQFFFNGGLVWILCTCQSLITFISLELHSVELT